MTAEEWRPIPGHPMYDVSDQGHVRTWRNNRHGRSSTPRLLDPWETPQGYRQVTLSDQGERTKAFVHQLVLLAFVGPRPDGLPVTRHLNGNPRDNRLSNVRYGTHSENQVDKVAHGAHHYARRTECPNGHPFDDANTSIRRNGGRVCRTCRRAKARALRALRDGYRPRKRAAA